MAIADVIVEMNRLQTEGRIASYALGGAVAAQAYITPMSTEDVDVFVVIAGAEATSLAPLRLIYADLISRGAKPDREYLEIGGWPVQLLPPAGPLYDAAIAGARTVPLDGQSARIMGPEHLAAIALQTGRGKDLVRLDEFITTGAIDMPLFNILVEQFGLTEKWNRFRLQFGIE